ncbi:hypothetical protein X798_05873 [Onchocerca flexuosa]|uniref:Uncharacterized protein n=1 Tax=Onchocerca flexuosa TaxID=387005 RepID=A0A238BP12_9BILA|nr:hypothetical protein X798_05873 [Onchocerca flexuosa]
MNNRRRSHSATRLEIRNRFAPRFSSSIRIDATKLRTQNIISAQKIVLFYKKLNLVSNDGKK